MALSRFASIRGWSGKIYSDLGSQLVGAGRALKEVWKKIDRKSSQRISTQNFNQLGYLVLSIFPGIKEPLNR